MLSFKFFKCLAHQSYWWSVRSTSATANLRKIGNKANVKMEKIEISSFMTSEYEEFCAFCAFSWQKTSRFARATPGQEPNPASHKATPRQVLVRYKTSFVFR